jgi:hypothetical protein
MPSEQTLLDRCFCHGQPTEDGAAQGGVSIEVASKISALE